jgi:hypothetical protein
MRTSQPIVGTLLLLCIMVLGPGSAAFAASVTHDADDTSRLDDTLLLKNATISWLHPLTGGTCTIPAAVGSINPVDKTGDRVRKVTREVLADGSQVIVQDDLKTGTAEDSNGDTYHFVYNNRVVFNVSLGLPAVVHVKMTDSFHLTGHGLHTNVSFAASWNYSAPDGVDFTLEPLADFPVVPFFFPTADGVNPDTAHGVTDWQQLSTQGDPANCDPL